MSKIAKFVMTLLILAVVLGGPGYLGYIWLSQLNRASRFEPVLEDWHNKEMKVRHHKGYHRSPPFREGKVVLIHRTRDGFDKPTFPTIPSEFHDLPKEIRADNPEETKTLIFATRNMEDGEDGNAIMGGFTIVTYNLEGMRQTGFQEVSGDTKLDQFVKDMRSPKSGRR